MNLYTVWWGRIYLYEECLRIKILWMIYNAFRKRYDKISGDSKGASS